MPPPRLGLAALGVALAVAGCGSSPRPVVAAFPSPGARAIAPQTSISLRGAAAASLGEVLAVGSRSGAHVGRLVPHSDGRGASFVPTRVFAPGGLVTVSLGHARVAGTRDGRLRFRVAGAAHPVYEKLPHHRGAPPATAVARFVSRPELHPTRIHVDVDRPAATPGDVFVAPKRGLSQP